jgi:hypothetical protein
MTEAQPPLEHADVVIALQEAFADLIAAEEVDVLPHEGESGNDIAIAGEHWTLYVEGWPGPEVAFIAIEDEPDEDAAPEDVEQAWRDALPDAALSALAQADERLGGRLHSLLTATGDPVSVSVAAHLPRL